MKGQITWVRNQLKLSEKRNPNLFETLKPGLAIDIYLKYVSDPIRVEFNELDSVAEKIGTREIKSFSIILNRYLGRKFESRKVVVREFEEMLIDYYRGVLQHLKRWEKPVPQIPKPTDIADTI